MRRDLRDHWSVQAGRVLGYRAIILAISVFPQSKAFAAARAVGRLRYRWWRDALALQSTYLQSRLNARPEQVALWLQRSYEIGTCEALESCLFRFKAKEEIARLVDIRGLHMLDAALSQGKGAILFSGHVPGNYTFLLSLVMRDYRAHLVRIQPDDSSLHPVTRWFFDRYYTMLESKFGCRFFWMRRTGAVVEHPHGPLPTEGTPAQFGARAPGSTAVTMAQTAKEQITVALRRNEVVIILIDLSFSKRNIEVRFFDSPAYFPSGPAELAEETGAALIDFFVHRPDHWVPQVAVLGVPFQALGTIQATVQQCASRLEANIRKHPAEWSPWHVFKAWQVLPVARDPLIQEPAFEG